MPKISPNPITLNCGFISISCGGIARLLSQPFWRSVNSLRPNISPHLHETRKNTLTENLFSSRVPRVRIIAFRTPHVCSNSILSLLLHFFHKKICREEKKKDSYRSHRSLIEVAISWLIQFLIYDIYINTYKGSLLIT